MRRFLIAGLLLLGVAPVATAAERPNIVLIMVDDMGFSDLGCYGSEIRTPHLDTLARSGLRFTQFYNCAKCETTRASLISGRHQHEVGIGKLQNCITIAEGMRLGGYTTLMTGKWHLSGTPVERGFDRYFGHLSGACNFFRGDSTFRLDDQVFAVPKEGFYTTDANTDYALEFLHQRDKQKPFFLYIAYNAPHYPLQAPREDVERYRGQYRGGWDQLRTQRHARMKALGIVDPKWPLSPRPADVPAWNSLTVAEQDRQDLVMATFAAMIDRVDQNIGRLVEYLKAEQLFDDTLILFLSDNGACPFQRTKQPTLDKNLMPWDPDSYWTYDKGWAHACNTPFREYKRNQHEGGISTPLIAHWPHGIEQPGSITSQPGQVVDLMATCLDLAGVQYPQQHDGQPVGPPRGLSLVPIFQGQQRAPHPHMFFTFYGTHNALRVGNWKLVNIDAGPWELYDLEQDRTELTDLAASQPDRLEEMRRTWTQQAQAMKVPAPKSRNANRKKANRKKQ